MGRKGTGWTDRLAPSCVWIACCTSCVAGEKHSPSAAELALPVVAAAPEDEVAARCEVTVTKEGRVRLNGKSTTVNGLIADATRGPIRLRADREASWGHVQWVMAALGEAGHKKAACSIAVAGRDAKGVVTVRVHRGVLEFFPPFEEWRKVPHPVYLSVEIVPAVRASGPPSAEYRLGLPMPTITRDPSVILRWAKSALARSRQKGVGVIAASGVVPYRYVAVALAALQDAGATELEVGLQALHPWDRDLRVLPAPRDELSISRWCTDLELWPGLIPLNLPVASMCSADDAPNDRIILNLTAGGRLVHGGDEITLDGLASLLAARAEAYDRKMESWGRTGSEEVAPGRYASKLFVLLRADQDAPLQHVRWIMAELAEARYFKLQIATRKTAGPNYSQMELERQRVGREALIYLPTVLAGKLQLFLGTVPTKPDQFLDVRVEGSRFTCYSKTTRKPEELAGWLRNELQKREEHRTVGRVLAGPHTSFGEAVAAVNCFASVGIAKVDIDDAERAPDNVRRASRLPR